MSILWNSFWRSFVTELDWGNTGGKFRMGLLRYWTVGLEVLFHCLLNCGIAFIFYEVVSHLSPMFMESGKHVPGAGVSYAQVISAAFVVVFALIAIAVFIWIMVPGSRFIRRWFSRMWEEILNSSRRG